MRINMNPDLHDACHVPCPCPRDMCMCMCMCMCVRVRVHVCMCMCRNRSTARDPRGAVLYLVEYTI